MTNGFTLTEVIAVLAILAISLGVAGLAMRENRTDPEASTIATLNAARDQAVSTGEPVLWRKAEASALFLPDGSSGGGSLVVEGRKFEIEALTGMVRASR